MPALFYNIGFSETKHKKASSFFPEIFAKYMPNGLLKILIIFKIYIHQTKAAVKSFFQAR